MIKYWVELVMWALILLGLPITAFCLMLAGPAHSATYFNPVPNTLTNGTTGLSAQVNADYNQIITDGNAANTNLLAQIAALGPGGLPAGAVVAFNSTCPSGFALADGLQGRPDARGLYIRGLDNQAGRDPNRVLGSYQADQIQNHFHTAPAYQSPTVFLGTRTGFASVFPLGYTTVGTGSMVGPAGISETRPDSSILNYCVNNTTGVGSTPFSTPPQILSNLVVPDANIMMTDYNRIISDGNTAFNAFQAAITSAGTNASMPTGAVVPFKLTVCPSGWAVADGTGGTVDMRGRFARITQGSPVVGTVQGDQFIDHTHTIPGTFVNSGNTNSGQSSNIAGPIIISLSLSSMFVGTAIGANVGTETRPKNVALLYCQKS